MKNFSQIKLLDVVVLTNDLPEYGLRQGQSGTVVEVLAGGSAFEVEFSVDGRTVESVGVQVENLTVLRKGNDNN